MTIGSWRIRADWWPWRSWTAWGPSRRTYARRAYRGIWFLGPLEVQRFRPGHRGGCWDWPECDECESLVAP